ncbi:hypothetical protein ACU61A_34820 [Pseudonocardia sichuanensis]|uniref:hypothetical protein n=1 Tax=Pseudonocardia kunmingensis TaxID=630975 RepID=UPI00114EFCB1|nr:hypothetical protein [Pseudonocardia kunmingensis]
MTRNEREFIRLADALGEWPTLVARLLRGHGEVGVCSGCTMPGGRNTITAPCPVRYLALLAQTRLERVRWREAMLPAVGEAPPP